MKSFAIAVLTLGICAVPGLSQGAPKPRREEGRPNLAESMEKALGLSDAQKASIREIQARHKETVERKGKAAQEARRVFMEAFQKPESGVETLKKLHRASSEAELSMFLEHRIIRQEIGAVLTPEQKEKAARLNGPALRRVPAGPGAGAK